MAFVDYHAAIRCLSDFHISCPHNFQHMFSDHRDYGDYYNKCLHYNSFKEFKCNLLISTSLPILYLRGLFVLLQVVTPYKNVFNTNKSI